jgi:hypothetical protein
MFRVAPSVAIADGGLAIVMPSIISWSLKAAPWRDKRRNKKPITNSREDGMRIMEIQAWSNAQA